MCNSSESLLRVSGSELDDYALARRFEHQAPKCMEHYIWKGINSKFFLPQFMKTIEKDTLPLLRLNTLQSYRFIYQVIFPNTDIKNEWTIPNPASNDIFIEFRYTLYPGEDNHLRALLYGRNIETTLHYLHTTLIPTVDKLLAPYIDVEDKDTTLVKVLFSFMNKQGSATTLTRKIECPRWKNIKINYPYIFNEIETLLKLKAPDTYGKFIFWHGPPGTGKTYLIRSLIQYWNSDVETIYITDPEYFFDNASYMNEVLFLSNGDGCIPVDYNGNEIPPTENKLKLFIIEDGLDFILKDSRGNRGEAMSRLLNLTDGILGQGLKHIFLVTSNEVIANVDTAFLRAGRMLQELEFAPFINVDAETWLNNQSSIKGIPPTTKSYTLSELYEIKNDNQLKRIRSQKKEKIGII